MSMVMFTVLYPDLGAAETRCIIVQSGGRWHRREEEAEEFALFELYCAEPGCNCRRVLFNVVSKRLDRHVATINHAFEAPGEKSAVSEQTFLDPLNRQSDLSEDLLAILTRRVLMDSEYCRRLERHYAMFKEVVNNPQHPLHGKILPYFDEPREENRRDISDITSWRVRRRMMENRRKRGR